MIWILLSFALLLSFLVSGMESAVLSVSRVRLRYQAKEKKDKTAIRLEKLFTHRDRLLSAILLLNNTLNILVFAITTKMLVDHLGAWGYGAAIVISLPVYLLWLELFPKSLFKRFPYRALSKFLPLLQAIFYILGPFAGAGPWLAHLLRRNHAPNASGREAFLSLTNIIEREGKLSSQESAMIHGVLDFNRVTARDVMIPLSNVTAIPLEMPVSTAVELGRETRIDQFPVMAPDGELVGLFNVFEVLLKNPGNGNVVHYLHRLVRAHPGEKAITIIRRLRRNGIQLAAVYSSSGRPLGIVTSDDLVRRMLNHPR